MFNVGASTLRAIAEALNARGIPTPRGGRWHATSVRNVFARA
jgi:Recombinase